MKYIRCIPAYVDFITAMLKAEKYRKPIEESRASGDFASEREYIRQGCLLFVNHLIDKWDLSINVTGAENIPKEGPVVYIGNHQSYADALGTLKAISENHQIGYVGKDYFGKIPYFGKWVTRIRCLYLHRGNTRNSLRIIGEGVEYLKDGFSLVIFPEGTRSKNGEMGEFKPGSFKLATKAQVPIVPISLNDGRRLYEDKEYITKGTKIDLIFHPPIQTAGLSRQELTEIPARVEEIIRQGLNELQAQK
jgi:1-acyl-sn-glycerol-3-phosphate acyltransferase